MDVGKHKINNVTEGVPTETIVLRPSADFDFFAPMPMGNAILGVL